MAIFKCKMCGATLQLKTDGFIATCDSCGTTQTIPRLDDERKINLFNRANIARYNNEFDIAKILYETILVDFPEESEAFWGLCLATYGIEYITDPISSLKIPTCHRTLFESILDSTNFQSALNYADAVAKQIYIKEAKVINALQQDSIKILKTQKPYDVFICYKETTLGKERTEDSLIAEEIFTELTNEGYRVFFSRISLEETLGLSYEPYIFAALTSSKIMITVATNKEHLESVWVKNEWSRFLALMEKDGTKYLIPVFKYISPYDLPKEFKSFQGLDYSKIGVLKDLIRGINKLLKRTEGTINHKPVSNPTIDSLLKRIPILLEDRMWTKVHELTEIVLNSDPHNAHAYIYKFCAQNELRNIYEIKSLNENPKNDPDFRNAVTFSNGDLKGTLQGFINYHNDLDLKKEQQEKEARLENQYKSAIFSPSDLNDSYSRIRDIESYKRSLAILDNILFYKDAKDIYEKYKISLAKLEHKHAVIEEQDKNEREKLEQIEKEERKLAEKKRKTRKIGKIILSLTISTGVLIGIIVGVNLYKVAQKAKYSYKNFIVEVTGLKHIVSPSYSNGFAVEISTSITNNTKMKTQVELTYNYYNRDNTLFLQDSFIFDNLYAEQTKDYYYIYEGSLSSPALYPNQYLLYTSDYDNMRITISWIKTYFYGINHTEEYNSTDEIVVYDTFH